MTTPALCQARRTSRQHSARRSASSTTTSIGARVPPIRRHSPPSRRSSSATTSCEAASAYLGRPVGVKHVNAQINDQDFAFWKRVVPGHQAGGPLGQLPAHRRHLRHAEMRDLRARHRPRRRPVLLCPRQPEREGRLVRRHGPAHQRFLRQLRTQAGGAQEVHGAAGVPAQEGGFRRRHPGQFARTPSGCARAISARRRTSATASCSTATACIAAAWSTRASGAACSSCLRKSEVAPLASDQRQSSARREACSAD